MSLRICRGRLALVVPALLDGGGVPAVAKFVHDVALKNGFSVTVVSLAMSRADSASTRLSAPSTWFKGVTVKLGSWQGARLQHVGAWWTDLEFQHYRPRSALAEVLKECDVLQVVCGSPAWANAVVGLGKPVSLQVATRVKVERRRRDANPKTLLAWWRLTMTGITDMLDDRALRAVDAIQLENPWMLDYCQKMNNDRAAVDIRYAPPGVDAKLFRPMADKQRLVPQYVLCVGRLNDTRKNISLLLNAFSRLPASLSHVQLITAGAGDPPADYWALVEALGMRSRVRHIHRPETVELVRLYQEATVFALASDEEGLGVVILEAMACAVPVVATRCGGPDGIITDGKDGFLVPLDDPAAMADRLAELLANKQRNQQMGLAARATIEARYADDVAGKAFVEVWDKLLEKSGKL